MGNSSWQLEVTRPAWLAALVVLPLVVYYARRSLVHFPRRQRTVSLAIRLLLVVVLVAALCGVKLTSACRQLFVVFAVDQSISILDEANQAAEAFLDKATEHAGRHRVAFLPFAAEPGAIAESRPAERPKERLGTDLAAAIAAAGAAVPSTCVPRIVLLSDGNQTVGNALAAAKATAAPVWTVPLPGVAEREVYVSAVETAGQVRQGEPFYVEVVIQSTHDGEGTLRLSRQSQEVVNEQKQVRRGENRFRFRQSIKGRPAATFTARIEDFEDTLPGNNQAGGVMCAPEQVRVLLVESRPESARPLAEILAGEGIGVTVRPPQELPLRPDELLDYDLLMLANVPAALLTAEQIDTVRAYVGDFGGGLITVGGDRSFTSGGYHGTKLEEILPVECRVARDRPKPSLAMVLVIDRSESMEGQSIELAKQATWLAVEELGPGDQVGVIAFEDQNRWESRLGPCSDAKRQQLRGEIDRITAGGGTNMYPAMEKAYLALRETYAELKHMIVLTDGVSHPGDFDALSRDIAAAGITVSTVGMGDKAIPELLRRIADIGNGRAYTCDDPADVPQVFRLEATSAGKVGIVEEVVAPKAINPAEVFADLDLGRMPQLLGYVETVPKQNSRLALAAEDGDPLLAWWQFGRGISVAFTSEVRGDWAPLWLDWPDRGRFWAELVRHAMRKDELAGDFVLRADWRNDRACAILDALDPQHRWLNGAEATLKVTGPDGATRKATFTQIAPGRYAAEFAATTPGAYYLEAGVHHGGRLLCTRHRGLVVSYPDELRVGPANRKRLQAMAESSGGRYAPEPAEVFAPSEATVPRTTPYWPYLLAAAALLFVLDVAMKRIELGQAVVVASDPVVQPQGVSSLSQSQAFSDSETSK